MEWGAVRRTNIIIMVDYIEPTGLIGNIHFSQIKHFSLNGVQHTYITTMEEYSSLI